MLATCHTPECTNAGHTIDLGTPEIDGVPVVVDVVLCGVCGQSIDDLS